MREFGTDGLARSTNVGPSKSHLFGQDGYYIDYYIDIVGGEYET